MRKLSGIFAALLLLLSACAPAAVPTEETTPETQGEELVSTLSMLPKQAISIHRAETPAEEDTETDRTDIVFVPYYASVEQLTSNSWVDQTHVTKSTVLNLTKTDAVEVKWEANALLAGGRWVTSQEELQTVCSYLRSRAENPEKEALYLSLGRRGQASPGNTKGADRIFIRQRLCFRWQKYRAVWSKCQEQNAIFDILDKPEKKGQRKLWQTSFFLGVARPHLDMEQQAHQRPQREGRGQRHDRLEVLQKKGLGDLCRHEELQRRRQAGAHLVVEVVPVVEEGRPHIVIGGPGQTRHDDEQADGFRQPCDEGDGGFQKALQQMGDVLVQVIQGRHALATAQASRLLI